MLVIGAPALAFWALEKALPGAERWGADALCELLTFRMRFWCGISISVVEAGLRGMEYGTLVLDRGSSFWDLAQGRPGDWGEHDRQAGPIRTVRFGGRVIC